MPVASEGDLLPEVYRRLLAAYGPQAWWPAENPFEVVVGAILVQNTAWSNVERALARLKEADAFSASVLRALPLDELAVLIRSSGTFRGKARKLKALAEFLGDYNDDLGVLFASKPLPELRRELQAVHGIGPETADAILLYAGGLPVFVAGAYTVRILTRLGILSERVTYDAIQGIVYRAFPVDTALFNELHALLVAHGKTTCRERRPRCSGCSLLEICPTGQIEVPRVKR